MTDSVFSVRVWLRRTPRGRWRPWQSFASGVEATAAIREAKARGKIRGETLTIFNGTNPNEATREV